jgi:hypothetical protein
MPRYLTVLSIAAEEKPEGPVIARAPVDHVALVRRSECVPSSLE